MCDDVLDLTDSPVPQRKATHANANGSSPFRHNSGILRGVPDQSDEEDHFETAASQSCAKKKTVSASKKRGVDPEKLAQREATEANKVAKKEAAEALKRQKEIEKERKRLEKESIQLQKEARTEERRIAAQMSGKHKDSEVSLIIEDRLYNSQEGLAIIDHLRQQTGEKERPIQFLPAPSRIPNLLRWTFRSLSDGGGCNIGEPRCRVMEFAVVLMPAAEYIQLATDTDDSIDFDALGTFVDETRRKAAVTEGCPDHCRLTILLNDLDKEVNKMVLFTLPTAILFTFTSTMLPQHQTLSFTRLRSTSISKFMVTFMNHICMMLAQARSKNNATSISGLQAALAALDGAEAYLIAEKGVDVWKVLYLRRSFDCLRHNNLPFND
jgi:hypothetical protein